MLSILTLKVNEMTKSVKGSYSPTAGSTVRRCYDDHDNFLGVIVKMKKGYRIVRTDGKTREKSTLAAAFASIKRSN